MQKEDMVWYGGAGASREGLRTRAHLRTHGHDHGNTNCGCSCGGGHGQNGGQRCVAFNCLPTHTYLPTEYGVRSTFTTVLLYYCTRYTRLHHPPPPRLKPRSTPENARKYMGLVTLTMEPKLGCNDTLFFHLGKLKEVPNMGTNLIAHHFQVSRPSSDVVGFLEAEQLTHWSALTTPVPRWEVESLNVRHPHPHPHWNFCRWSGKRGEKERQREIERVRERERKRGRESRGKMWVGPSSTLMGYAYNPV